MKRSPIAVFLLLLFLLTGCGPSAAVPQEQSVSAPTEAATAPTEAGPAYDHSLLSEKKIEGMFTPSNGGNDISYSFCLPQLPADNPDAIALNDLLLQPVRDMEAGSLPYQRIFWEDHWNGGLLSLVLTMQVTGTNDFQYRCYHYDFASGRTLRNADLLASLNVTEEEAEQALRKAAVSLYDLESFALAEAYGDCFADRLSLRAETLSELTTEINQLPIYLDDSGRLHCFGLIGTFSGDGAYRADLLLDLSPAPGVTRTAQYEFIRAELKNNQVTVTFEDTGLAGLFVPQNRVEFHKPYQVQGLYGDYTDLSVGFQGNGGDAYLFLLDTTGHVTFCNLMQSARLGRFTAVGPLLMPKMVRGFEARQEEGGHSVVAITESGEEIDLYEHVWKAQSLVDPNHYGASWYTEDGSHCMNFHLDSRDVTWAGGWGMLAQGEINRYMGMNEQGLQYEMLLLTEEGNYLDAVLTRQCLSSFAFPEGTGTMTLTQVSGQPLSGLSPEGTAILVLPEF